jgi:CBS domain containing-hemolysin-like protein
MLSELWSQILQYLAFDAARLAEPDMLFRFALQACLLLGSAFFSGSETALFSLSDLDLEQLRGRRDPRTDLLHDLLSQPRRLIVSILCGNELINIAATANMTGILLALYGAERAGLISILIMVPLLLLFGEITPKTISVSYPVQVSTRIICAPMNLWVRLITPARWLIRMVADRVTTWVVGEARDVDHLLRMSEFRSLVADIEEEGLVSATDRVLIYNLLDAGNTEVEHIMTPRTQIRFARPHMHVSELVDLLLQHRLMRIPVFEDTPDHIVGFVHAEEVMELVRGNRDITEMSCSDILRAPSFVPITKNTDEMLDFFQTQDERAAMVLDEFGGVAGMVTMEDVLNFIFGEIAGEFIDIHSYKEEDENIFTVSGSMKLNEFEALTNFGIEDPRMTTIGGVTLRHLDRLPQEGDQVIMDGIQVTVLEMDGNRIARLRAAKLESLEESPEETSSIEEGSAQ